MKKLSFLAFAFLFFLPACSVLEDTAFGIFEGDDPDEEGSVENIDGEPTEASEHIYETVNLNDLCDDDDCNPDYDDVPDDFVRTDGQEPLDERVCNYDYSPNLSSSFDLHHADEGINGLSLLLSKEDLFFIAWVSMRMQINPHFLLGVLSQESAGNCSAVSPAGGEGCFQITNTFGQGQLNDSYPDRVSDWHWTDNSEGYYDDDIFIDEESYFGERPESEQFRLTLDPGDDEVNGTEVSSVVNFPHGAIASGLYYKWQALLLATSYSELADTAEDLFQSDNGKALWQAAAYNGGAYGAAQALEEGQSNFLIYMEEETQDYAVAVVDYCIEYQKGEDLYYQTYTESEVGFLIDLLEFTYADDAGIDWDEVKEEVHDVFFEDGGELTFSDDIKALIYVISTFVPELGPEWPEEGSI